MAGLGSDPPFLSVSVTEPVKMGTGMQAYISYRVSTKVRYISHFLSFVFQSLVLLSRDDVNVSCLSGFAACITIIT